jgi:hypothetical protein
MLIKSRQSYILPYYSSLARHKAIKNALKRKKTPCRIDFWALSIILLAHI